MSCCYGWRIRSYATNGRAAPTRNAAPPAVKAGWSRHPKAVVVVLGSEAQPGETALEGTNMLGQLLTELRGELRRRRGDTGKATERYLNANVRKDKLVINGRPVS